MLAKSETVASQPLSTTACEAETATTHAVKRDTWLHGSATTPVSDKSDYFSKTYRLIY